MTLYKALKSLERPTKRFIGFNVTLTNVSPNRWVLRRGKSTWWFSLPEDNDKLNDQIRELTEYATKLKGARTFRKSNQPATEPEGDYVGIGRNGPTVQ